MCTARWRRLIAAATESTRNGMSSLIISTNVKADEYPCSFSVALKIRRSACPGRRSAPKSRWSSATRAMTRGERPSRSSKGMSAKYCFRYRLISDFFLRVLELTLDARVASMMSCRPSPLRRFVFVVTAIALMGTAGPGAEILAYNVTH